VAKKKRQRRLRGEGSIFHNKSKGWWVGRVIVGKAPTGGPRYKEVTGRTADEVRQKMDAEKAKVKSRAVADGVTVAAYFQHWLENVAKPSVAETTWASYERCVRLFIVGDPAKPKKGNPLSGVPMKELQVTDVEAFFAWLVKDGTRGGNCTGGNARKVAEVLCVGFENAVIKGGIPSNPVRSANRPRAEEVEIIPFTADEIKAIRQAATGTRLEALTALAVGTGARQGELLALNWPNVDLDAGTIRIQRTLAIVKRRPIVKEPKSKRGRRVVELPRFAVEALRDHRRRMEEEGHDVRQGLVFCTRSGYFIFKDSLTRQVYRPLLKRAGVVYRKFHTLRHTHISELLSRGESVVDVAKRVGDRPEVILKNYGHYIPGNADRIKNKLDQLYG
jgi:integrase